MKLPGEKARCETDLYLLLELPAMVYPTCKALHRSPTRFCTVQPELPHIKEKLGPYSQILPFAGRGTEMKGEGRVLCSLPAASCAGSLY